MTLRTTSSFAWQSWTVALFSLLCCGIGLAQVGVSSWLWAYSHGFALILGETLRNAFIGYIITGASVFVIFFLGFVSALLRNRIGLVLFGALTLASMASQGGIWTFILLEQLEIYELLESRIQFRIEYYDFLSQEFNCNLVVGVQSDEAVQSCASFLNTWLMNLVWAIFGLTIVLICLQFFLIIMAAMLHTLVKEESKRNIIQIAPASVEENSSSSSTTPSIKTVGKSSPAGYNESPPHHNPNFLSSSPFSSSNTHSPEQPGKSHIANQDVSSSTNASPIPSTRQQPTTKQNTNVNVNTSVVASITVNQSDSKRSKSPFVNPVYEPSPGLPSPPPYNDGVTATQGVSSKVGTKARSSRGVGITSSEMSRSGTTQSRMSRTGTSSHQTEKPRIPKSSFIEM